MRINIKDLPKHHQKQVKRKLAELPVIERKITDNPVLQATKTARISKIQQQLWESLKYLDGATLEYQGAVPNRRFAIDIAFPALKIAVEVDGWQYHGKYKEAHQKDRERQNLLVLNGWRVLRFTAAMILREKENCVKQVQTLIELVRNA